MATSSSKGGGRIRPTILNDAVATSRTYVPSTTEHGPAGMGLVELTGIGIGGIIGAGFFLGTGLAVQEAGPGVVVSFLLGGLILSQVLGSMVSITVNNPVRGSFRVYAEQTLGNYIGFVLGWIVWVSGIVAIGSEALAMAIFARYWLPQLPVWALAFIFVMIVLAINAVGTRGFSRLETIMSFIKVGAIVGFIIVSILAVTHVVSGNYSKVGVHTLLGHGGLFPHGVGGVLKSMLIIVFTYSGISVIAMAATEVRNLKRIIPTAALSTVVGVVVLYSVSMVCMLMLTPWTNVGTHVSPFVQALLHGGFPLLSNLLNAVILVAAFSVMTGTFFSTSIMLESLGRARLAPAFVSRVSPNGVGYGAWVVGAIGIILMIAISYVLSSSLYNYLTSASSYFGLFNWVVNLITFLVWRRANQRTEDYRSPLAFGAPVSSYVTIVAIVALAIASLFVHDFRMGAIFAAGVFVTLSLIYPLIRRRHPVGQGSS